MTEQMNDIATRWAVLRDSRPLTQVEQQALDNWLAQGDRHVAALFRAEAILAYASRAQEDAAATTDIARASVAISQSSDDPQVSTDARATRRRFLARSAMALAATLVAIVAIPLLNSPDGFTTEVGEVRRIPLPDGSTAMVNTASRITVTMQEKQREIAVVDGEAWFDVAHDKTRPFVVEAGDVRVRAVGTAFSVRRQSSGVDILVTDGVVEVWRDGAGQAPIRVKQGQRSFVPATPAPLAVVTAEPEIERALAWRSGELALNGEPLSYAIDELNRYNHQKIVIMDPVIGRTPIVGYFRTNDPASFAQAVSDIAGARVQKANDAIQLIASDQINKIIYIVSSENKIRRIYEIIGSEKIGPHI